MRTEQIEREIDALKRRLGVVEGSTAQVSHVGDFVHAPLTVKEIDGAPSVDGVSILRVSNGKLTDDGGGQVSVDVSGSAPDASGVTYTPADNSDWTGAADPGNVDDALDQIGQRVTDLAASIGTFVQRDYFGANALKGISATPQNRGTDPDQTPVHACANNATNGVLLTWMVPGDWDSGAVTVILHYAKSTANSGDVVHRLNTSILAVGDDVGETGTTTDQTVAVPATVSLVATLTLGTFTPAAAGALVRINYRRMGADGADTSVSGTDIIGIELQYTAKQAG